jgi:hypothetical protein
MIWCKAAVVMGLLAAGGCAGDGGGADSGAAAVGEPGPGAFDPDFETSGAFFTQMAGPVEGGTVHGTVQIWYSANLREGLEAGGPFVAPVGSVAIKVQDNGAPAITAMVKREAGFDPDDADWSYEQRDADGALTNEGALPFCIDCHSGFADTDYLGGTELR